MRNDKNRNVKINSYEIFKYLKYYFHQFKYMGVDIFIEGTDSEIAYILLQCWVWLLANNPRYAIGRGSKIAKGMEELSSLNINYPYIKIS